jgi:hypothetical protein
MSPTPLHRVAHRHTSASTGQCRAWLSQPLALVGKEDKAEPWKHGMAGGRAWWRGREKHQVGLGTYVCRSNFRMPEIQPTDCLEL